MPAQRVKPRNGRCSKVGRRRTDGEVIGTGHGANGLAPRYRMRSSCAANALNTLDLAEEREHINTSPPRNAEGGRSDAAQDAFLSFAAAVRTPEHAFYASGGGADSKLEELEPIETRRTTRLMVRQSLRPWGTSASRDDCKVCVSLAATSTNSKSPPIASPEAFNYQSRSFRLITPGIGAHHRPHR